MRKNKYTRDDVLKNVIGNLFIRENNNLKK